MQLHLCQVRTYIGDLPLTKPEVLVARAGQVFNADGRFYIVPTRGEVHGVSRPNIG
jgi:hypothetical protein